MKRRRLTAKQKYELWAQRWLIKNSQLKPDEIEARVMLAYLDGYEAAQRAARERLKAKQ